MPISLIDGVYFCRFGSFLKTSEVVMGVDELERESDSGGWDREGGKRERERERERGRDRRRQTDRQKDPQGEQLFCVRLLQCVNPGERILLFRCVFFFLLCSALLCGAHRGPFICAVAKGPASTGGWDGGRGGGPQEACARGH